MVSEAPNAENMEADKDNTGSVGALLRASRLRLGDDLRFVAETLHIRYIYLEAIENGQYDKLPGAAYAIGFIRTYADYLGLDSGEVVRRYKVESVTKSVNSDLVFPVPIPESSIPAGAIVFVGVIIALLAYGGWYVSTAKEGFLAGFVSPVPERLAEDTSATEPQLQPEPEAQPSMKENDAVEPGDSVEEAGEDVEQALANAGEETSRATEETTESAEQVEQGATQASPATTTEMAQQTAGSIEKVEDTAAQATAVAETEAPAAVVSATATTEETAERVQESTQAVAVETTAVAEKTVEKPVQTMTEQPAPATEQPAPATAEPASATEEVTEAATPEPTPVSEPVQNAASAVEQAASTVGEGEPEPAPSAAVEAATQTASTTEVTASATAPENTSARVYGADQTTSRILVKARQNSWIQVRDNIANRLVMTRLLRAGDSYRVPDQEGLVLLTGNAGALEILVDGETVPDLGGTGAVRRNVTLDPDLLRQGTAAQ